jgi:hypothetical protein
MADLSTKLQTTLRNGISDDEMLNFDFAHVEKALHTVYVWASAPTTTVPSTMRKLGAQGRALWNVCVKSRRDATIELSQDKRQGLVLKSWLLAYLFFELGRGKDMAQDGDVAVAARMLKLVLTVAAAGINDSDLDAARFALQRGASHINALESAAPGLDSKLNGVNGLLTEYYTLRILLVGTRIHPH